MVSRYALLFSAVIPACMLHAQELCDNGVDDDADGLIDLNDSTDCVCGLAPVLLDGILPNPSFEDFDCMPSSYSQVDCISDWFQGTSSTSDYFLSDSYMPLFIPQPLPSGGIGCIGGYFCHDYMEYVGTCLLQPLEVGTSYELHMSISAVEVDNFLTNTSTLDLSPLNVTVYGLSTCPSWPTGINLCPANEGWTEIGHANYTPSTSWSTITVSIHPTFDVAAIMLGSPCQLPVDYPNVFDPWLAYFFMDELSFTTSGTVGALITSEGNWCEADLVLTAHPDSTATDYQWYQNGIAIEGASDSVLAVSAWSLDSGEYVFRTVGDSSCSLTTYPVETEIEPTPYIALTVDGLWCPLPGTYQWFLNGLLLPGATDAYLVPSESGVYTVELTNAQGCSTLSYPFDWLNTVIQPLITEGIILWFSADDATLRVSVVADRSELNVFDATGRLVVSTQLNGSGHRVSLMHTAPGIYVARLNNQAVRFLR